MKYLNKIVLLVAVLSLTACGSNSKKEPTKLGKIEVEIPAELKDNPEMVEYINGTAEVADSYAFMIDNTLSDVSEYVGVEEEDLSMMDKIKLVQASAEIAMQSAEIMVKWGQYMEKRGQLSEELTDAELEALNVVWVRFEKRMEEIELKYGTALQATGEAEGDAAKDEV